MRDSSTGRRTTRLPSRFRDFDLGRGRAAAAAPTRSSPTREAEARSPQPQPQPRAPAGRGRRPTPAPPAVLERGVTRSGIRFSARNLPYYRTVGSLLEHHKRLLLPGPFVETRYFAAGPGSLLQTTIRFSSDHSNIRHELRRVFLDLFNQHSARSGSGFEVVTTFNAVLSNRASTSFSIFYGHDYRTDNTTGAYAGLRHGEPVLVRSLLDLHKIPSSFDLEALARTHRHAFESSDVRVVKIINVVYLVYQYRSPSGRRLYSRRKPVSGEGASRGTVS